MSFNLQPIDLKNDVINLLPLQETDFSALYVVANDELLWEQHPNKLRYQRAVFQNFFEGAMLSKGAFIIRDSKSKIKTGIIITDWRLSFIPLSQ